MSWSRPAYEAVALLLGRRTGLTFTPARQASAEQGIRRAMTRAGVADPERYRALLESDERALDQLIVELTVGETYFFREPAQFEFIRAEVLPELMRRRGPGHAVRVWSAGCASGEEAYSLAILLTEAGLAGRAYVLATDISRAALAKAHQAAYSDWSLRGPGAAAAAPYLRRHGDRHVLREDIRRLVTFEYLNLALDVYPSFATGTWGLDLILCRNVLIYFDRETVRGVARRLFEALAPGGWLVTASSDPPLADDAPFETVVTGAGVFYRRTLGDEAAVISVTDAPFSRDPPGSAAPALPGGSRLNEAPPDDPPVAARSDLTADAGASALRVRALANRDSAEAERVCAAAVALHPLEAELHLLHAVLLLELGRGDEAARAARRVIYLDRTLAVGHLTLGAVLWRRGDMAGARRAYRNARDLCAARPADEVVPLSDGERAGRLAAAAAAQLAVLDAEPEVRP